MANQWFAFYGGDYDRKTGHLTLLEHGVYLKLMLHCYNTGDALPDDPGQLQRICRAHSDEELKAISRILSDYFRKRKDGWHNDRCDVELRKSKYISKVRSEARLNKRKSIVNQVLPVSATQPQPQPQEPKVKSKAASAFCLPDWIPVKEWQDFEEMRRKMRKPMTDRARALIATELLKLRTRHDPAAVLEQSIRNSWQDVYELRGENGTNRQATQPIRQPSAQVARWNNNRAERERARAAVVGQAGDSGNGQETRFSAGNSLVLDGEVKKLQ